MTRRTGGDVDRPVRVLMAGSVPPEWGGRTGGGVATMHRALMEEFLSGGHGVEVVGLLPLNLDPDRRGPDLPVPVLVTVGGRERDSYEGALGRCRPDVVLFQHIAHRWAALHARLRCDVPAVGVVHSWNALTTGPPDRAAGVRRTVTEALTGCTSLVFVSSWTRSTGSALGFHYPGQVTIIHNPLQRLFTEQWPDGSRQREGWVFVGSLIDRKNPMVALEAAARSGKRITFIGDGPWLPGLRSAADGLSHADRVHFAGWLPPREVRRRLLRAELLCVPSADEGFSMSYLEALSCGAPVIGMAANVRELAGLIGMECGAGVAHGRVEEVLDGAARIAASAADRWRLRQATVEAFAPAAVARSYARHLRAVSARTGAGHVASGSG
jgi:glycosyltransferase involved in cell wall biosynthesis